MEAAAAAAAETNQMTM